MNENGYIRKIDELGRIVIPKELRRRLKIQDGENLIINHTDNKINLSKYSYIGNNKDFIAKTGDKLSFLMNVEVLITDLENIIYSSKNYSNKKIEDQISNYSKNRESALVDNLIINDDIKLVDNVYIEPIISNSIGIGVVILVSEKKSDNVSKLCKLISEIISYHINIT
ncbi:MAG: stage V sporulation T C-terminal domain-containing protein [Bacilli bacterium]|nr:stage V sporulation T C-terminal domain-containing protein [Bacilli bacterium]MDD4795147.1 stage V sporulation T C-terminal domain-containing protein [Bacilli bacterium]